LFAIQDGTVLEETWLLESLRSHPVGSDGKASRPWADESTPGYLAGYETLLFILQDSTELSGTDTAGKQWEQSPQNTENWNVTAKSQDLVLFLGLQIWSQGGERRKSPIGERSWLSP
jgi:hypothetical protein